MTATADVGPYPMNTVQNRRDAYLSRWSRMQAERSDWMGHWEELGRFILPRSPRFSISDRNRGGKHKYGSILDNTPTRAARTLSAGIMSNMTSPGRRWFRFALKNQIGDPSHEVQMWLDEATEQVQFIFNKSNYYRGLQRVYDDLGVFGTGAMLMLSDFETVTHCYNLSVGEYCLAQDFQGRITTCYREFQRTVREVVDEFGIENCSNAVQDSYKNRHYDSPVDILHVIEPRSNEERNIGSPLARDMPWKSCYLETAGDDNRMLREGGFRRMRVLAPRWLAYGNDIYGTSPGMDALGDIRQLNQQQLRKGQAIDYQTKPPLQIPQQMRGRQQDALPGGVTYYEPGMMIPFDQNGPHGGIRPAFEVRLPLDHLLIDIQDVRTRINSAFFRDVFLMFSGIDESARMTIPEVLERQGEKLLMIGPVVERLGNELLEPSIDIAFQEGLETGVIPPPPPELAGQTLEVEFLSVLAQAQRAVGITGVQQWMTDNLAVANAKPDVIDNVDFDEWSRQTAMMRGVPARMVKPEAAVDEVRRARAEAEAAQAQMEAMNQGADTVQKLATAPVDQNSALDAAMDTLNGTPDEA